LSFLNTEDQFDIECVMQWSLDPQKVKDCLHVSLGALQERVEVLPENAGQPADGQQPQPQQQPQPPQPQQQQMQGAEAVPQPQAQDPLPGETVPADPRGLSLLDGDGLPADMPDDGAWLAHELAQHDGAAGNSLSAQLQGADSFTQGQLGLLAAAGLLIKSKPKSKPH